MKRLLFFFSLVAATLVLDSCSKSSDPEPVSPIVGRWTLNRGLLSGFTTAPTLNGRSVDLLYFENYAATIDIYADKTFNSNDKSVTVDDSPGTWDYVEPNLTLKYDSGTQETYTYAKTKNIEEITLTPAVSYTLPVSSTATAVGSLNFVYRK